MKTKQSHRWAAGFIIAVLVLVGPGVFQTSAATQQTNVIAVQTFGATYGEWSARWWQWLLSIPAAVNPNLDQTGGANGAQGQVDDVWFLAGSFGGSATRAITIPAGKPIFFPIINSIVFKPFGFETLLDLRQQAAAFIDTVTVLQASIDGKAIQNLSNFRVRSPSFTVIAPPQGLIPPGQLSVPGNTDPIVSDGYWLLLSPLSPGSHTIHFHAETSGGFMLDVTYNLTVE